MSLLLLYVGLALSVSFLCSLMEATLLSVTPSYVAALEQRRRGMGRLLRQFKQDIDRPLAAILTLNTIANTFGAAGAGAQAARVFGSAYLAAFSAVLTLAILFLSEIIPKTLGAVFWRRLAPVTVRILAVIIPLLWPLVWLARQITRLIARGPRSRAVEREEFTALAELGAKEGLFRAEESRVLKNLFRLGSLRTKHIMTPRIVVHAVPESETVGDVLRTHTEFRFSRIPVYGEDLDDVTGYVLKDDLLLCGARDEHGRRMGELKREIVVVPETLPISQLLERFLDSREHIALVVDEYGGTAGIVAMEDVVETVLGLEIVDEADKHKDMQALAREQWVKRAKRLGLVSEDFHEPQSAESA
ncbi:MAG: hemolysin family protein [Gemmatimonadota bacterium]|nr:hemolysin family protein [Gemmatimonadota bacterium]